MSNLTLSSESLCRITDPRHIEFDEEGNFLPHDKSSLLSYGKTVPLVRYSELDVIVDWFYSVEWRSKEVPYFVLLIFQEERLKFLTHRSSGILRKHGEYFAVANKDALEKALFCRMVLRSRS